MSQMTWLARARTPLKVVATIFISASALIAFSAAAATYTVVDLATLEQGTASIVRGPNGKGVGVGGGQVVGKKAGPGGRRGLLFQNGAVLQMSALPGSDDMVIFGMNDSGVFVGNSNAATALRAFTGTQAGELRELAPLAGDTASAAFAVSHLNQAVGFSSGAAGQRAVVWSSSGTPTALPVASGVIHSKATAINARGDIAGVLGTAGSKRPVVWSDGQRARELMLPAGHPSGEAYAINARGDVVGYAADTSGKRRATLWQATGGVLDLGALPGGDFSQALDGNDSGDVVGSSTSRAGSRAFLWTHKDGMQDLNSLIGPSNFVLTSAVGINNVGMIMATGHDAQAGQGATGGNATGEHVHDDAHEYPVRVFLLIRSGGNQ